MSKQTLATIVAAVVLGGASASALAQGSAAEGIARYREMLQDGNPAELIGRAWRGDLEGQARAEERVARAVRSRPRAGRHQGRLRADAALLCGCRPGDGFRIAGGLVHGQPAGHGSRGDHQEPVLGCRPAADGYRGTGRVRGRDVARHAGQHSAGPSQGKGVLRSRHARPSTCAAGRTTFRAPPATA